MQLSRRDLLAASAAALAAPWIIRPASAESFVVATMANRITVRRWADGLANPWGLAFLDRDTILVTERARRLRIIRRGILDPLPVAGLPGIYVAGQGGLLDIVLHPRFATNRQVYLSYAVGFATGNTLAVGRATWTGNALSGITRIFEAAPRVASTKHFGGSMAFGRDGMLHVAIGERDQRAPAQRLDNHLGKVVRIRDDGSVPPDNPFVGRSGALPQIWTYGHRNPQGLAVRPATGQIYLCEHGPRGGDEVNLLTRGGNYGWPIATWGTEYNGTRIAGGTAPGTLQPLRWWGPTSIAPSGLHFYDGPYFSYWRDRLFMGALAGKRLLRLRTVPNGTAIDYEEVLLNDRLGRIRAVKAGPDGFLYLLTDADPGAVWRIEPA